MSTSSIGMPDTTLPVTTVSTNSAQSPGDTGDASAPQFAAVLSAAHAHQGPPGASNTGRDADPKQTSTSGSAAGSAKDSTGDPKHGARGQNGLPALDLALPGGNPVSIAVGGAGFRPVGTGSGLNGSHRVRVTPQDADTGEPPSAALAAAALPAALVATAVASAALPAAAPAATPVAGTATPLAGVSSVSATAGTLGAAGTATTNTTGTATANTTGTATTNTTGTATTNTTGTATTNTAGAATAGTAAATPAAHALTPTGATGPAHPAPTTAAPTMATTTAPQSAAASSAAAVSGQQAGAHDTDRDNGRGNDQDTGRDTGATAIGRNEAAAAASAQNVQQATSTSTLAPTVATSASTATAATYASAQPELAQSLAHLSTRANGEHEMTVSLHPAELGAVHVRALMHDGVLTVTIACADESARNAVTAALPDLHHQLADMKSLDVQLSGGQSNGRSGNAQAQAQSDGEHNSDRGDQVPVPVATTDSTGAVSATNPTTSVRRTGGRNDGLDRWM